MQHAKHTTEIKKKKERTQPHVNVFFLSDFDGKNKYIGK
jgi:hypothetical protein